MKGLPPWLTPWPPFASRGSQRGLQIAVNRRPDLLNATLANAIRLPAYDAITWVAPLAADNYTEYWDCEDLRRVGVTELPKRSLKDFWPPRRLVWDGLVRTASESATSGGGSHPRRRGRCGYCSTAGNRHNRGITHKAFHWY